jgi:hypothetical protein
MLESPNKVQRSPDADEGKAVESNKTNESPEVLFEFFKQDISHIIKDIKDNPAKFQSKSTNQVFIDEGGIRLSTPSARLGKHSVVYFLSIEKEGKIFECVLRGGVGDAQQYLDTIKKKPIAKEYLPKLYGIENREVIMERLHGAEFEIKEKIKDDSFRAMYAKKSSDAVYVLSTNGLIVNDVAFSHGHNVIAHDDGSFKFIEQISLVPNENPQEFSINELIADNVLSWLRTWASRPHVLNMETEEGERHTKEEHQYDFAFQFLKNISSKVSLEDLFIKYRYYGSSHSHYREMFNDAPHSLNLENSVKTDFDEYSGLWNERELTDEEYEALPDDKKPLLPGNNVRVYKDKLMGGRSGTAFNPRFIQAIKDDSIEEFKKILDKQQAVMALEDIEENRVVLI